MRTTPRATGCATRPGWAVLVMGDGDLLESAVLAPRTFAEAEAAVARGDHRPTRPAGRVAGLGGRRRRDPIRGRAFETTDALVHGAFEALDYVSGPGDRQRDRCRPGGARRGGGRHPRGRSSGAGRPSWVGCRAPGRAAAPRQRLRRTGRPACGPACSPGRRRACPVCFRPHRVRTDAAGLLAGLFPDDGSAEVATRPDLTAPGDTTPPGSLAAVLAHLDAVNRLVDGGPPGEQRHDRDPDAGPTPAAPGTTSSTCPAPTT